MSAVHSDDVALGPVDVLVIEYPDHRITGAGLGTLHALAATDVIRILDAERFALDDNGAVVRMDLQDDSSGDALLALLADAYSGLLDDDDLLVLAGSLTPGASLLVVVFESSWTATLDLELHAVGARLAGTGYVDVDDLSAALDAPTGS